MNRLPPPVTILVTGFGAFPGARSNPTLEIVRRLARVRRFALLGIRVETRVLRVEFAALGAALSAVIVETGPRAIIHLGLAARRKTLCVETRALNRVGRLRPDAARRFSAHAIVEPGGPAIRKARWPADPIRAAIRAAGAPARLSIDAGDYLCNQALYLTLAATNVPAGFIHVPKPARGGRPLNPPGLSIAAMARGVEAVIVLLAARCRRRGP